MLHSSSFYFDSYMHHILFSTSESTEKNQYNNFLKKFALLFRASNFNKQKDPSDLMFINNMPIKIRQKHLTQQSKTVPSNFERSP